MIVVDSSAVVAIIRQETEAEIFTQILDDEPETIISAVSLLETNMVVAGRREGANPDQVSALLASLGVEIAGVDAEQAMRAVEAFLHFGKGRHPARLNLADCFTYALAKSRDVPLLFKGDDFSRTDIVPAWRP